MGAQDTLTKLEAAINARLDNGAVLAMTITVAGQTRNLQYESLSSLMQLKQQVLKEVAAEQGPQTAHACFPDRTSF